MKVIKRERLGVRRKTSRKESQTLINELHVLKKLHHPNIVQIKEIIDDGKNDSLYLVMQHLPGQNLQEKIDESQLINEPISRDYVKKVARQLVSALYTMHVESKLVHHDIKPENIVLNKQEDIVLVDFGISRHFYGEDDLTRGQSNSEGTILYFAPERVKTGVKDKKIYGRQTDIWAAGITLYYLATGIHPYTT
jgi:serine/threonine protein kinase